MRLRLNIGQEPSAAHLQVYSVLMRTVVEQHLQYYNGYVILSPRYKSFYS